MEDLAGVSSPPDELGPSGVDIGDDQVQALHGARGAGIGHQGDRARRSRRCQLHHAEVLTGTVVDEQVEAGLLEVEGLGPVHVGHRDHHKFELPLHDALPLCVPRLTMVGACGMPACR